MDEDLLQAAEAAIARMDAREGEDIEEWAEQLAEDLSKFTD